MYDIIKNDEPEQRFPNGLEAIWKPLALLTLLKAAKGPLSLRVGLGVSQSVMGKWLAFYARRDLPFRPGSLSVWERVERAERLPAKYIMSAPTRDLYRKIVAAVVELAGQGRYRLVSRLGVRRWHFALEADCAECGKPFQLRRGDQVRCRRCIAKGKR